MFYDRYKGSRIRVKIEEVPAGGFHVGPLNGDVLCPCDFYICEHGKGFNYVSVLLTQRRTMKVGASTFDMQAFLNPDDETSEDFLGNMFKSAEVCSAAHREAGIRDPIPESTKKVLAESVRARQELRQSSTAEAKSRWHREAKPFAETILPLDSSSQIGRDRREFMPPSSVLSDKTLREMMAEKLKVESVEDGSVLEMDNQLVKGHFATARLQQAVVETMDNMIPINGLPKPCTNQRLNFLMNLHTALDEVLIGEHPSFLESMRWIQKTKTRRPHVLLLQTVVDSTMDLSRLEIKSNCFRLPYINVGMVISERTLGTLFNMLNSEFQLCWFNEFKGLKVPKFHSTYSKLSPEYPNKASGQAVVKRSSTGRHERKSQGKRSSILGF